MLPRDDKSRLMRIARMFDVTEYEHPSVAEIFVKFTAGSDLGSEFGVLNIQI